MHSYCFVVKSGDLSGIDLENDRTFNRSDSVYRIYLFSFQKFDTNIISKIVSGNYLMIINYKNVIYYVGYLTGRY